VVHLLGLVWLWFTVLFANFAEAMAEGRGKAQAASCAKPGEIWKRRSWRGRSAAAHFEMVPATSLREGPVRAGGGR